ncbi:DNA-binding Lrp family transcriptional regulator [Kineosphaera limosa]|uniref:Putative AsnC family transcriptional regulator n=1 Tax=Kineosphaera limosa NBRC 100340 TaxID=1184609 RepID=K6WDH6_9MICO|nr:Lrp/AsnC family transcriptional regulator [Kineosphaera limosa]NYE01620.1 DNA-binding Lrp family transcriptional regulator [Kineosphaera limosa]GAB97305.1 putative AsnC family transcriptional regulator [Kineosphaera limosa NBRC 100340]
MGGIDETDRSLVRELVADGRASVRGLAQRLHISRANAYARLERLLSDGVIRGFTARVDPEKAGLATSAYVTLSIEQNAWREVSQALRDIEYVEHFALVGAEVDVVVLVRTPDNATLRRVVLEQIQAVRGVKDTRTWLIFGEVEGRGAWRTDPPATSGN